MVLIHQLFFLTNRAHEFYQLILILSIIHWTEIDLIKVCILDYGSGNVKSVYNMVSYLGFDVSISNDAHEIQSATHIILPGVGSFASAMLKITKQLPLRILEKEILMT